MGSQRECLTLTTIITTTTTSTTIPDHHQRGYEDGDADEDDNMDVRMVPSKWQ